MNQSYIMLFGNRMPLPRMEAITFYRTSRRMAISTNSNPTYFRDKNNIGCALSALRTKTRYRTNTTLSSKKIK